MHGKKEKTFLETCLSVLAQRNDLQKWKEDSIKLWTKMVCR
jgi:hypothetical protein